MQGRAWEMDVEGGDGGSIFTQSSQGSGVWEQGQQLCGMGQSYLQLPTKYFLIDGLPDEVTIE